MSDFIYVFSLVAQLSGGIILLINNTLLSNKRIGAEYCAGMQNIECDPSTGDIVVEPDRLQPIIENIFLNRAAFLCLVVGYGTSTMGSLKCLDKISAGTLTIAVSIFVSCMIYMFVLDLSKKKSKTEKYMNMARSGIPHGTFSIGGEE